jgi:hypothetical protein
MNYCVELAEPLHADLIYDYCCVSMGLAQPAANAVPRILAQINLAHLAGNIEMHYKGPKLLGGVERAQTVDLGRKVQTQCLGMGS